MHSMVVVIRGHETQQELLCSCGKGWSLVLFCRELTVKKGEIGGVRNHRACEMLELMVTVVGMGLES